MPKNCGLKLFTKTWPLKRGKNANKTEHEERKHQRPLTATLDKPTILDIRFMGKIDMSTVRKEFLNISNLCRLPLVLKPKEKNNGRPLSLLGTETRNKTTKKKRKKLDPNEDSHEDEESSVIQSAKLRTGDHLNNNDNRSRSRSRNSGKLSSSNKSVIDRLKHHKSSLLAIKNSVNDANNNKTLKVPLRKPILTTIQPTSAASLITDMGAKGVTSSSIKLPSPCKTCGRPDLPERFHSHPATPLKTTPKKTVASKDLPEPLHGGNKSEKVATVKSSVQKPVAIKYKSSKTNRSAELTAQTSPVKKDLTVVIPKPSSPIAENETKMGRKSVATTPTRVGSAKRTLTCYICGREFGTASLGLHEPKCLQKWERENARLPSNLRRKPPVKPEGEFSQQEWNQLAWESSQATLVPCLNCGRTFFPDRLEVHQRSCKAQLTTNKTTSNDTLSSSSTASSMSQSQNSEPSSSSSGKPPSVQCYICGKMFGTHSIKIHEKSCLKKWHVENESLPYDMRSPAPVRPSSVNNKAPPHFLKEEAHGNQSETTRSSTKEERPTSGTKSPLFPCYLCGKLFTVNSIYIHEPQCLKMWKIENDKLPVSKRRPIPLKPDIKFTPSGEVDFKGTFSRIWENHLTELVQCEKCGRKFFPDRIEKHREACIGLKIDIQKNKVKNKK
ncbi:uncharacterized protein LOC126743062 isoform X2 [Anthonomus grandis grandis]|uniref:uncharacterized protein LOC126743062 isoform X2 n=1 Tax=Anthonomus grandis grandis TaxID=2921223 RepID=UPI002165D82A|nr:uncharacterized protein LOC126743062 isoform X2 [Anthonomus grandis grandis]